MGYGHGRRQGKRHSHKHFTDDVMATKLPAMSQLAGSTHVSIGCADAHVSPHCLFPALAACLPYPQVLLCLCPGLPASLLSQPLFLSLGEHSNTRTQAEPLNATVRPCSFLLVPLPIPLAPPKPFPPAPRHPLTPVPCPRSPPSLPKHRCCAASCPPTPRAWSPSASRRPIAAPSRPAPRSPSTTPSDLRSLQVKAPPLSLPRTSRALDTLDTRLALIRTV